MQDESPCIGALLDAQAGHRGTRPFLLEADADGGLDFAAARARAARVAAGLADVGLQPGESVGVAMANSVATATVMLGALDGGYRVVAVNLVAGDEAMGYAMAHGECRVVVVTDETQALVEQALGSDSCVETLDGAPSPAIVNAAGLAEVTGPSPPVHHVRSPDDDALIMYTSGTTGRAKGVVLSHANLIAARRNVTAGHELVPDDRVLCVLPLYHINGMCTTLMGPLVSASSAVFPSRFSASRFWHWATSRECTWLSVVPTQVSYLLHSDGTLPDGHSIRFARSASAPLAAEAMQAFEQRFGVPMVETMGLTETAAQVFANPMPPAERCPGSPGRPVGAELRIVDGDLNDCADEVDGELLVRGASVMQRYHRNPEATEQALTADGWLRTGDLGRRDADGWIFITGRLKELIIKGGENIAPREIDEALLTHADVIESAAFGRPCKDYGERVEAAVAVREGACFTESELIALCEARLGRFKSPDRVHLLAELPKGPSGKVQRRLVAALCPP